MYEGSGPVDRYDILSLLRMAVARDPNRIALEEPDVREPLSYSGLLAAVEGMGWRLRAHENIGGPRGRQRVAMVLPNGGAMSMALLSVTSVATAIPFDPKLTEAEFERYFHDCGVDAVLTCPEEFPRVASVARRLGLQVVDADASCTGPEPTGRLAPPDPGATALVLLTSGSTGKPKRVALTHANVCTSARDVARSMDLSAADRCLSMWQLFHIGGLVDLLLAPLYAGGTIICTPGFDRRRCREMISRDRPTWFQGVPTTLRELLREVQRQGAPRRPASLRLIRSVAAPLSRELMAELETTFGVPVLQTFGMTEASPLITSTRLPPEPRKPGAVGRSCGCEIRVCAADGAPLATGQEGELWIRGPNVFSGYENDALANAESFCEGWFRTGDIGRIDADGCLFLTGRIKEIVNRGGEKINLREVDDALSSHAAILEAASFPVAHPTLGEDIAACVVLEPDAVVDDDDLQAHLRTRLADFKVPRRILRVPFLPRTSVGKIDRTLLSERTGQSALVDPRPHEEPNALETEIASIWARELDCPKVGVDDHFIDLGGDSLAAVRVLLGVENAMGPLPVAVLRHPLTTVRALGSLVSKQGVGGADQASPTLAEEFARRILLPVIATGPTPPVREGSTFKLANGSGRKPPIIWFFNGLQKAIKALSEHISEDQPIYGGYSGAAHFRWDDDVALDALADHYAAELQEMFPDADLRLGGNCQGGKLAWRVSQRLVAQGRRVCSMCLLEYAEPEVAEFEGELLMMFGIHSLQRHYRPIRWGSRSWARIFSRQPQIVWVPGMHGRFFSPGNVRKLAEVIGNFHDGVTVRAPDIDSLQGRAIWLIHRSDRLLRSLAWMHSRFRTGH